MTGLQVHVIKQLSVGLYAAKNYVKSPAQGAATTVYAALSKESEGTGEGYLEDCQEGEKTEDPSQLAMQYHPWAYNEKGEKKLWVDS